VVRVRRRAGRAGRHRLGHDAAARQHDLPLLWAGLVAARSAGPSAAERLWGAVAGYLSLWSVYWLFKLTTGKEGMGYGDFKLLAALGAWLGWQMILPIVLAASVIGAVVGIGMKCERRCARALRALRPLPRRRGIVVMLAARRACWLAGLGVSRGPRCASA
jgi:leader peptidase (prepilin peptidase)/N-methyltransferase